MEISRRSFIGGTIGSIALISGGLSLRVRKIHHMSAIECKERYGHLTEEQIKAARTKLEENGVTGKRTLLLSEQHHADLIGEVGKRKLKSVPILPDYEVIKWQRLM